MTNNQYSYLKQLDGISKNLCVLNEITTEEESLEGDLNIYCSLVSDNESAISQFPNLVAELSNLFSINYFNFETSKKRIIELEEIISKIISITEVTHTINEIEDPQVGQNFNIYRNKADKAVLGSLDSIFIEAMQFQKEYILEKTHKEKREQNLQKLKVLIAQDEFLIIQFPLIKIQIDKVVSGEVIANIPFDYVFENFPVIKDTLSKINENHKVLSSLTNKHKGLVNESNLTLLNKLKDEVTLESLQNDFTLQNEISVSIKKKILEFDNIRKDLESIKNKFLAKINLLPIERQEYFNNELNAIERFLSENFTGEFEQVKAKINSFRDSIYNALKLKKKETSPMGFMEMYAINISFLNEAESQRKALMDDVDYYLQLLNNNYSDIASFPELIREIESLLFINIFNAKTSKLIIANFNTNLPKLKYISDMLADLKDINDAALEQKLNLSAYKSKFRQSADRLNFKSIDALHFEMKQFEEKFKSASLSINNENQKRQKIRGLIMQESILINQFPLVKAELEKIIAGETFGSTGADYILANFPSIKSNLAKINEFSIYFSKLTKDYISIFNPLELDNFRSIKSVISIQTIQNEFIRLNAKSLEFKNRILKLDNLRSSFNIVKKDYQSKIHQLALNHRQYIDGEISAIEELIINKVGIEFEKADQKIVTVRDLIRREFKTTEEKFSQAFVIRQTISKFEDVIFQEDSNLLRTELEAFSNGTSRWRKEDFDMAIQGFVKGKNEIISQVRSEFDLYLTKNRDYRNKLEKIANTQSSKYELESLLKDMSSFKVFKTGFYKFIK